MRFTQPSLPDAGKLTLMPLPIAKQASNCLHAILLTVAIAFAPQVSAWGDFGDVLKGVAKGMGREDIAKGVEVAESANNALRVIDEPEEIRMGSGMASVLLGAAPLVADEELQRYVNRVGTWIAAQSERSNLAWRFGVIDSPNVNAFTTPGGYVLITKGLWHKLRSESELAGVLGHEIAHVLRKHHLKAIQNAELKKGLAGGAELALSRQHQDAKEAAKYFKGLAEIYIRGLDKDDEYEADRMGVVLAARAGYNPYGLVGVLQTLAAANPKTSDFALMTKTHPTPSSRLDYLEAAMGNRLEAYESKSDDFPRFTKLRK